MKKVLLTATVQSHIAQFHKPLINLLKENGYEVHVAARDNLAEKNGLELNEPDKVFNVPFDRSPLSRNNIFAYKELNKILSENKYDIVHCNTPMGGVVTRLAAKGLRKNGTKLIYTAHGFHFYKGAPLKNWMFYYPVEYLLSYFTDILITINKEDFKRAQRFKAGVVKYIPGTGIETKKFDVPHMVSANKRKELNIPEDSIVLLSVGELNENKNFETIIKAITKINSPNLIYLIRGNGPLEGYFEKMIKDAHLEGKVKLLGYGRDIPQLCAACDIFVLPSKREGLGLAALEAMAAGKPIITSNLHGIKDYSINGVTGLSFNPLDEMGFVKGINKLIEDESLRIKMGQTNVKVANEFDVSKVINILFEIYSEVL